MTLSENELEEFSARTERERIEGGLPPTITDRAAIRAIARLIREAEAEQFEANKARDGEPAISGSGDLESNGDTDHDNRPT